MKIPKPHNDGALDASKDGVVYGCLDCGEATIVHGHRFPHTSPVCDAKVKNSSPK